MTAAPIAFRRWFPVLCAALLALAVPTRAQSLTVTSLTADQSYPLVGGTPVTWTATVSGASGDVEYQFVMLQRTTWVVMQPYSASSTFSWTPQAADAGSPYVVQVWARTVGSTETYESYLGTPQFDVLPPPILLTTTVDFPTPPGYAIGWTASTTAVTNPEFEFRVLDQSTSTWTVFRAYDSSGQAPWTPAAAGTYVVEVRARSVGNPAAYEQVVRTPTLNISSGPITITSFTTPSGFPAPTGAPITWTAHATGGQTGPIEYQFLRLAYATNTWTIEQPYSTNHTFTWTPTWNQTGEYGLQVWARSAGSTETYEAWRSTQTSFQINRASVQLSTSTPFPAGAGLPITWTAHVPDSSVNFEYQFVIHSYDPDQWTIARAYAPEETYTWTPSATGRYAIQVWARQVGSTADYEVYHGTDPFDIVAPCTYQITPTAIAAPQGGQTGYVAVTTSGPACTTWTPTTAANWITLDAPIFDQWEGFEQRVLADRPLGSWGFHETVGATTAFDYTGHGLTATLSGGAAVNTLGLLDLDGISGNAAVPASTLLTMTNALTAELWVQTTSSNARIIGAVNGVWHVNVTGGALELQLFGQVLHGNLPVNDNQPHFIDATWDGATAALYVDGAMDATTTISGTLASSAAGLMIGADPVYGNFLAGQLQVVSVFDHALTATQIADRFTWQNGEQTTTSGVFGYTIAPNVVGGLRTATILIVDQTVTASQSPALPVITSVSPTGGAIGTEVTIVGSGFGTTQQSSTLWLGTKPGVVSAWGDTSITATVAAGSLSGSVQIRRSDGHSNEVLFTVATPAITSVSPTGGSVGTTVSLTGSGFGTTQGSGQVWLGTAAAVVTSWTDAQVVAMIAEGSSSGNAQILQNGVWTNAVPFTVSGGAPVITSISPNSGVAGAVVSIDGSGFGVSQGAGEVWIGGVPAPATLWGEAHVEATVANNALTGTVKIRQNGVWSNAMTFRVGSGAPGSILNPNVVTMLVGDTRSLQALDDQGRGLSGLSWASSDPAIVSLSADDPPVLTALAPGTVTVAAGTASADVTVLATPSMPTGTVLWSSPGNASGVSELHMAVPNFDAVADVFARQNDGSVQAITSDGTVAWTATVGTDHAILPDFKGGLVAFTNKEIYTLAPLTGQASPVFRAANAETEQYGFVTPAIHPDGTIMTVDYACGADCGGPDSNTGAWVVGIEPTTAEETVRAPLANSVFRTSTTDAFCGVPGVVVSTAHAQPIAELRIAGDGRVYLSYVTTERTTTRRRATQLPYPDAVYDAFEALVQDVQRSDFDAALNDQAALYAAAGWPLEPSDYLHTKLVLHDRDGALQVITVMGPDQFERLCETTETTIMKLHLQSIGTDGSSTDVVVKQWSGYRSSTFAILNYYPFWHGTWAYTGPSVIDVKSHVITDADTGALYSWHTAFSCQSAGALNYWTFVRTDACPSTENHLTTVASVTAALSDVTWFPPAASADGTDAIAPVLQLDNGAFAADTSTGVMVFDRYGNVMWTAPGYSPVYAAPGGGVIAANGVSYLTFDASGSAIGQFATLTTQSWTGHTYQLGSVEQLAAVEILPELAFTFSPIVGANDSRNNTAIPPPTSGVGQAPPAPFPPCTAVTVSGDVGSISVQQSEGGRIQWGVTLDEPILGVLIVHELFRNAGAQRRTRNISHPYIYRGVGGTTHGSRGNLQVGSEYTISPIAFYPPFRATGTLTCIIQ